ncbi:MAG: hypothetical protein GEU80_00845 [Dehalococcoidia bacterium]|nr:hypothetical protein [Dehalococcoidia bacterium]
MTATRSISEYRLYGAIRSQPMELDRLLSAPEPVDEAAEVLARADRVFTIGIGTSSNAASVAANLLSAAGLDARAWSSADFALYPPAFRPTDAAVVYTHTGRKRFSREALRLLAEHGVASVLLTSTESVLTDADYAPGTVVLRSVPRDPSSMFTVSHTAAMLLSARIAEAVRDGSVGPLARVPAAVDDALKLEPQVEALAHAWQGKRAIIAVGAGPHEPSAHEAHIKIAEAARRAIRSYAVEQFLHGPQVQVHSDEALLIFAGDGPGLDRSRQAAEFARTLGCDVAWIAPIDGPAGASTLRVADVGEWLAPIVEVVPAQLLAGHLAALAGVDGDNFRMDEPAFQRAREALEL